MMSLVKHYILFPNYISGLALETHLKKEKIKYTIVPTPRQLSASCGICIMYEEEDEQRIKHIIEENAIKIVGFRSLESEKKNFYLTDKA
jgi:ribosomal protein L7Ae-like RNA K-turn-binding protein